VVLDNLCSIFLNVLCVKSFCSTSSSPWLVLNNFNIVARNESFALHLKAKKKRDQALLSFRSSAPPPTTNTQTWSCKYVLFGLQLRAVVSCNCLLHSDSGCKVLFCAPSNCECKTSFLLQGRRTKGAWSRWAEGAATDAAVCVIKFA